VTEDLTPTAQSSPIKVMRKLFDYKFAALLLLVFSLPAFAQSNEQIERELVGHLRNIEKWSSYGSESDGDKLSDENEMFREKLLKYTKSAATLRYKFGALDEYMQLATSADEKFRIYSWDTQDGGTMHNYSKVFQFQGADGKVYSQPDDLNEGDPGSFAYDIFTLDAKGGKVYLVCTTAILSTSDNNQTVRLYKIAGSSLKSDVKLIKTKSGLTDSIGFSYNFFSVVDREDRPVRLILFDSKTKTLKIPVVIEDKEFPNGRVTNKFISYRFDGTYFVRVK
jgi:hypothetical protein